MFKVQKSAGRYTRPFGQSFLKFITELEGSAFIINVTGGMCKEQGHLSVFSLRFI